MRITVLGSGTSTGVPVIGCSCEVCRSENPKNKRTRSSIYIVEDETHILVDTTPDLRFQALRERITRIDAVIYTHTHADHLHGIDELRIFNFLKMGPIPIYSYREHLEEIKRRFSYIFDGKSAPGGGKPWLIPEEVKENEPFKIGRLVFIPLTLYHGNMRVLGFRLKDFAYLTDCNRIPDESMEKLRGVRVLIIDALRYSPHPTHFSLSEAIEIINVISPEKAYLTHMSHDFDHEKLKNELPDNVEPSYDGMVIEL